MEFKIARPFGDNGKEAENWSVNLLHPYEGNVSVIGDCMKLQRLNGPERKAVVVVGYEHTPPRIPLSPLFDAFACVATQVLNLKLGQRVEVLKSGLRHPVHQQVTVCRLGSAVVAASPCMSGASPRQPSPPSCAFRQLCL